MNKLRVLACFLLCSTLSFVSCSNSDENSLIMGTSLDYPPFDFSKNGEPMGFDIELAQLICKSIGYNLTIKDMSFSGLIPAVKNGVIDFAMAGLSANQKRAKNVDFSIEYYNSDINVLLFNKKNPITDIDNLSNKRIGIQQGSVQETALKELKEKIPDMEIISLKSNLNLVQELKIGRIDGIMISQTQGKKFVENDRKNLGSITFQGEQQGMVIMFKKGSPITKKFNEALQKLKSSGKLKELENKYFSLN